MRERGGGVTAFGGFRLIVDEELSVPDGISLLWDGFGDIELKGGWFLSHLIN
jgi:hypothetical protein